VGMALFCLDLEGVNYGGGGVLTGVNTMINKPFEIMTTYSNINPFPRNSTAYPYCYYNLIIQMTKNFGKVLGRA